MDILVKKLLAASVFVLLGILFMLFSIYLFHVEEAEFTTRGGPIDISIEENPIEFGVYVGVVIIASIGSLGLGCYGIFKTLKNK